MASIRHRASAAFAVGLVLAVTELGAQQAQLEPPDLSVTTVALSLSLSGTDGPPRKITMGGKGGCQNVGNDQRPSWVVGWSAADGSQLFTLTVQGLPDGKTEERFILKPPGERRFALTSVGAATIRLSGRSVRFTFAGTESGGRTLKGTVRCAGQTT
jgi:hypothetical protein